MINRHGWIPRYSLSAKARRSLRIALAKDDEEKVDQFLDKAEWRIRIYLWEEYMLETEPIASPAEQIKQIEQLENIAGALGMALHQLDPLGWQVRLVFELRQLGIQEPWEALDSLQDRISVLRQALANTRTKMPAVPRGRPGQSHLIGFIAELAFDYRAVFGKLPPKGRETPFQEFITVILRIIGMDYMDCSRLVNKAISRVATRTPRTT